MGKRQVQRINVSTPLVLPSFDFKVTSFQKVEVSGEEIQEELFKFADVVPKKTFLEPRDQDDPAQRRANMALKMVGQELNDQEKTKIP